MAARSRWLASYSAIASLEAYCKICSRLMLSEQNSAYPIPLIKDNRMKYMILSTISLLLLNCSSPHIIQNRNQNELSITYKDKEIVKGEGKVLYSHTIHLSHINIYQYIYKINNNFITYEYAQATDGYKFSKGVKRSVGIIFNTNRYSLEYQKGNLYFFRVNLHDHKLYLILENINSSAFKIIYGFSKEDYEKIKNSLKTDHVIQKRKKLNIEQYEQKEAIKQYIKTEWNPKVTILENLVSKPTGRVYSGRR